MTISTLSRATQTYLRYGSDLEGLSASEGSANHNDKHAPHPPTFNSLQLYSQVVGMPSLKLVAEMCKLTKVSTTKTFSNALVVSDNDVTMVMWLRAEKELLAVKVAHRTYWVRAPKARWS
ncbi:hypothetical protein H4582DRAFT_2070348 [Lactarius indigo]|nr:hypothetical protein H4582DRAFT_2070348 [Lactarius indigo]